MKSRFYDKIKLEGNRIELPYGKYTTAQLNALLPNGIQSISVERNTTITLYKQDNFLGFKYVINNVAKKPLKVTGFVKEFPSRVASITIECACDVEDGINVVYNVIKEDILVGTQQRVGYTYYQVLPNPPKYMDEPFGPTNPAIFIIPDFGTDIRIYECIQENLAQHKISSVMVDYPGIDRSFKGLDLKYSTIIGYYRTIAEKLKLLSKKPIVIGHGVGGAIAQLWALTFKFELRNLVLIDTAPYAIYSIYNLLQPVVNQWINGILNTQDFATIMANATYNTSSKDCQPDALKLELFNSITTADQPSLQRLFTQNPDNAAMSQAPQNIIVPTMVMHGSQDIVISPSGGEALAILIKGSIIKRYTTCHSPMLTLTQKFYDDLYRFINPSGKLYFK